MKTCRSLLYVSRRRRILKSDWSEDFATWRRNPRLMVATVTLSLDKTLNECVRKESPVPEEVFRQWEGSRTRTLCALISCVKLFLTAVINHNRN